LVQIPLIIGVLRTRSRELKVAGKEKIELLAARTGMRLLLEE
jgi:hypothetical protein